MILKLFQNLFPGLKARRGEVFNRRNTLSILRIERFAPTQDLSPRGGFEMASSKNLGHNHRKHFS